MGRLRMLLALVLTAAAGCVYGSREVVRDQPPPVEAPPPPPYDTSDAYQSPQPDVPPPPRAGADVTNEAIFYDSLSPYGYWTFVAPYGRVWVPAVAYGWRPYYYGQWVLTDWGWTFASDDPWGWAAYHYGRWNFAVGVGWYWIPGLVWGPAWVSWGWGAGYVTWCPLGPPGVVYGYHHPGWVAVPENHFTRPIATAAVPPQRTYQVVTQVRPIASASPTAPRKGSFGPPVAQVSRATGQQLHPVAATQAVRPRALAPAPNAVSPMRSPSSPRARSADAVRPPTAGPRAVPPGRSGGVTTPRTGAAAPSRPAPSYGAPPPPASSGPRAAPPASGAPHSPPPSGGGGPHAAPPSGGGGGGGGGGPHAGPPGGGPRANHR